MKFNIYEQFKPFHVNEKWYPNLYRHGTVSAPSASEAIEQAKVHFKVKYPLVHELDGQGREKEYEDD